MTPSQRPQVKGRGRVEELKKSQRGTRGTRGAELEHMRGKKYDAVCILWAAYKVYRYWNN